MPNDNDIFDRPTRKQSVVRYGKRLRPADTRRPTTPEPAEKKLTIALSPPRPIQMLKTYDGRPMNETSEGQRGVSDDVEATRGASEGATAPGPSKGSVLTVLQPSAPDPTKETRAAKRRRLDTAADRRSSALSDLSETDSDSDDDVPMVRKRATDSSTIPINKLDSSPTFTAPEPPRTPPRHTTGLPQPPSTGLRTPPRSLAAVRPVSPSPRHGADGSDFGQDVSLTPKVRQRKRMLTRYESLGKAKSIDEVGSEASGSPSREMRNDGTGLGASTSGLVFGAEIGTITPSKSSAPGTPRSGRGVSVPSAAGSPARLGASRSMPESPSRGLGSRPGVKTYGGTRSYLQQVQMSLPETSGLADIQRAQDTLASHAVSKHNWEDDDVLKQLGARPVPKLRESYTELKRKYATNLDSNDGNDVGGEDSQESYKLPPSVSDLRSKGENRAFMDELGYILDGLKSKSKAVARSSALDLIKQSMDSAWLGRLRICGQIDIVYRALGTAKDESADKTLDLATLLYLILVRNLGSLELILNEHMIECLDFLVQQVAIAETTNPGIGRRSEQIPAGSTFTSLLEVYHTIHPEALGIPLSESALAIELLTTILIGYPTGDIDFEALVQDQGLLRNVANQLSAMTAGFSERLDMREKGLDLFPVTQPDLSHLNQGIELLHILVQHYPHSEDILEQYHDLPGRLVDLAKVVWSLHAKNPTNAIARNIWMNILRLLSHMTKHESSWTAKISNDKSTYTIILRLLLLGQETFRPSESDEKIDAGDESSAQSASMFDVSCLALGVLSNLIDFGNCRATFWTTELKTDCQLSPGCVKQCRCKNRQTALENLLPLFDEHFEHRDNPSSAFLSGYMALFFCKLMKDTEDIKQTMHQILGSHNRHRNLITALEEFQNTVENAQQKIADLETSEGVDEILPSTAADRSSSLSGQSYETDIKIGLELLSSM